jgi:WD40 repeat protein
MAAATAQLASFETGHGDMVHDASFDYYGKRLATCSSDRSIKVFDVVGDQVGSTASFGHRPHLRRRRCRYNSLLGGLLSLTQYLLDRLPHRSRTWLT